MKQENDLCISDVLIILILLGLKSRALPIPAKNSIAGIHSSPCIIVLRPSNYLLLHQVELCLKD